MPHPTSIAGDESGHATPTPQEAPTAQSPTLDQELADIKKTLGGWWGRVQKQSVDALTASGISDRVETARKDLAGLNLIELAKKEATRLQESALEGYTSVKEELERGPDASFDGEDVTTVVGVDGTVVTSPLISRGQEQTSMTEVAPLTSFFSKLAKENPKLTSNLTALQHQLVQLPSSVQSSVQNSLASASTSNGSFENVSKLAETYLHSLGKDLTEFARDAVKIVPPPNSASSSSTSFTTTSSSGGGNGESRREERRRRAAAALAASGGRRDILLSKLRRDKSSLMVDPTQQHAEVEGFEIFCQGIETSGGILGEAWQKKIREELNQVEQGEGEALKVTFDELVPSSIPEEVFWIRYFFAIHNIDEEEARRRVVLGAASQDEEDFSWDLEDESETGDATDVRTPIMMNSSPTLDRELSGKPSTMTLKASECVGGGGGPQIVVNVESTAVIQPGKEEVSSSPQSHITLLSGRNSSEDGTMSSFDVVSAQQSADDDEQGKKIKSVKSENDGEDGEDSDWE